MIALAALARLPLPGLYQFTWDEVSILHFALHLVRYGKWTWLSNYSQWGRIAGHSPLSVYIAGLPYFFFGDPRAGRLFVGILGIVAVVIVFTMVKRYFGAAAAVITGVIFAVHAPAVDWSRVVWNPNYAQPFIALWAFTGLLGYWEGKPWARVMHWLALSFAIQAHPGNALLGVLSALLLVLDMPGSSRARETGRLKLTLLGCALAAVSFIPWGIGLFRANSFEAANLDAAVTDVVAPPHEYSFYTLASTTAGLTGSYGRRLYPSIYTGTGPTNATFGPGTIWPPAWTDWIYWAQSGLSLAGVLLLLYRGVRNWRTERPALLFALLGLWPLAAFVVSPTQVYSFYLMSMIFGSLPALGVLLGRVAARGLWRRSAVAVVAAVFVISQGWLTAATLRWMSLYGNTGRFTAPMQMYTDTMKAWGSLAQGRDILIVVDTLEGKRVPGLQEYYWRVVGEGYPMRIIQMVPPQGIPIPPEGALVAGSYAGATIPTLFGPGETLQTLVDGEPMWRWLRLESAPDPGEYDLLPEASPLFGNGMRVLGVEMEREPKAGEVWPITIYWQPERSDVGEQYTFSARLADAHENRFGQSDQVTLGGWLWRQGDTVVNRIEIPVSDGYPQGLAPRVMLIVYPPDGDVSVVDEAGNWVAPWMFLSPAGA